MAAGAGAERQLNREAHEAFLRGAHLFDGGAFFEAHEAWEERWRVETDEASRRFLQGLIQIAAGFHKLTRMHDPASAARLLTKGLAKVDASPEEKDAASIGSFCDAVRAFAGALAGGGGSAPSIPRLGI